MVTFRVAADEVGQRLDRLVVKHASGLGRRSATELFARGAVRVEGRRAKKGDRPPAGAEITVLLEGAEVVLPEPGAPLDVRLETTSVVVVSKPAGQPTAPVRLGERGTLAQALLGRYPELAGVGHREREPGLLHRLDTQTSGLVVAARSDEAFQVLRSALSAGRLTKRYLAVVGAEGLGAGGIVDLSLTKDRRDERRIAIADVGDESARAAHSEWRRLRVSGPFALVSVTASPASRHQVRVHLAALGHPIVGDALYGGPAAESLGERHALHASQVAWAGDGRVPAFDVEDPLPADLAALVPG